MLGISIDTGGLGERIASILRRSYGVYSLFAAKKSEKMAFLKEMRTEAYRGRLVFKTDSLLVEEMPQIIFKADGLSLDDDLGLHSDLLDATLYSFKHITAHFTSNRMQEKSEIDKMLEDRFKRYRRMKARQYKNKYRRVR